MHRPHTDASGATCTCKVCLNAVTCTLLAYHCVARAYCIYTAWISMNVFLMSVLSVSLILSSWCAAVYITANLSGGHLNPAVTLATIFTGHIDLLKGLCYIIAQIGGACVGSLLTVSSQRHHGTSPTVYVSAHIITSAQDTSKHKTYPLMNSYVVTVTSWLPPTTTILHAMHWLVQ